MISFFKSLGKGKSDDKNAFPDMIPFLKNLKTANFAKQKTDLVPYDLISKDDPDRIIVEKKLQREIPFDNTRENKVFGCFIGLAIGEALGVFTEGSLLDYDRKDIKEFEDINDVIKPELKTKKGQYKTATSLGICMADSILFHDFTYNGKDLRYRTLLWYYLGYNNGKNAEEHEDDRFSKGCGPATYNACVDFINKQADRVSSYGVQDNENGNGTIIRIAAVPIAFIEDLSRCVDYATEQSYTTHNGSEAAECAGLLSFVAWHLLNIEGVDGCKSFMANLGDTFKSKNKAVQCLAESRQEDQEDLKLYNSKFNKTIADRNWNWQDPNFKYSPHRSESGKLVGVYCMDALAMGLHIIYYANSYKEAILKAVNLGGDSVSLGATVGMLAGAMYGYNDDMKKWYLNYVAKWDEKKCAIRAYKLLNTSEKMYQSNRRGK